MGCKNIQHDVKSGVRQPKVHSSMVTRRWLSKS